MKKLNIIIVGIIVSTISIFKINAQVQQYDEQINVVAPYEPSVSDANKINVNPEYVDIEIEKEKIDYNTSSLIGHLSKRKTFALDPLEPTKESELIKKHIFYGKFGFGSNIEPFVDVYVNSYDNKNVGGGFHVKHNSAWRQMPDVFDNSYSNTDFDIYGKVKFKNSQLQAKGFYSHNMFNYYGTTKTNYEMFKEYLNDSTNLIKRVYHIYGGEISLANIKPTKTYYSLSLKYTGLQTESYVGDAFKIHSLDLPFYFSFYPKLFKKSKKEDLNIKFNANYTFSSIDLVYYKEGFNDYLLSLEPTYSFHIGAFALKIGLNTNLYNNNTTENKVKADIHPVVEIKTTIVPEAFLLTIGVDGRSYRNNFLSLYGQCKYLAPVIVLGSNRSGSGMTLLNFQKVTNEVYNFYGVFDTRFGNYINFSAGVNVTQYKDLPIFYSVPTDLRTEYGERVGSIAFYDFVYNDLRKISISADFIYDSKKSILFNLQGKYNFIELNDATKIPYPFNMPTFEAYAMFKYTLPNKKFSIGVQAMLLGGAKDVDVTQYYIDFDLPNATVIDLPLIYDLGLNCNYKIKTGIDLWLNLNNLLHYRNKLYIYQLYPEYPANAMLGITFSL